METKVYRVADDVVFRETNRSLIMAFDRKSGVMFECNDTASAVLKLIDGKRTIADVCTALGEEFDAPVAELLADVEEVIQRFEKVHVVVAVGEETGQ